MLPEYTLSIDPSLAENGEELGIFEIANTATPAIMLKGVAFSSQETKAIYFADNKKYRIAAPVVTPGKIYRKDPETEEEYYAKVTPEYIESVYVDFMAKRIGGEVFNEEHNEKVKPPSYILETWLVENPKTDKAQTVYGLDVPKGTWFAVQQFTDKEVYNDYVERGLTGFSIHGHSAMLLMSEQNKTEMEKEENKEVEAMETMQDGAKFMIGDKYYEVKDGVPVEVVEVVEETEMAEDDKTEETEMNEEESKTDETEMMDESEEKETELAEEETKETEMADEEGTEETEMADDATGEYYSKEEVDAKFSEVFDMLADLKKEEETTEEVEDVPSVQMSKQPKSRVQNMREKLDKFGTFSPNNK